MASFSDESPPRVLIWPRLRRVHLLLHKGVERRPSVDGLRGRRALQFSLNSPSTARNSAGLISRACATVTE